MDFKQAQQEYDRLKAAYEAKELSGSGFESAVNSMIVRDGQGRIWQMGVQSGKWYRYDGTAWQADTPPLEPAQAIPAETVKLEKDQLPAATLPVDQVSAETIHLEQAAVPPQGESYHPPTVRVPGREGAINANAPAQPAGDPITPGIAPDVPAAAVEPAPPKAKKKIIGMPVWLFIVLLVLIIGCIASALAAGIYVWNNF